MRPRPSLTVRSQDTSKALPSTLTSTSPRKDSKVDSFRSSTPCRPLPLCPKRSASELRAVVTQFVPRASQATVVMLPLLRSA
ncbi:hypothetical protein FOTG_19271 [Fusarium oxysporum f. sp. vasinfectum 25433]|uniref:Uncharacterized protein n=1 Tax=Fusarium oxysporum f. sp. vasinfectum 25433 TaxID=1089449 RepID=X0KFD6_FUSOX|nr:hypothetical protein FOTG_19271 [Fusarium oxysporum f. sp. vasinfectum 25433]